jgi:hypothetical protein
MEAIRRRRLALGLGMLATALALGAIVNVVPSAGRGLSITRAEKAARKAVLAHPSYREITATLGGLVTRSCRRTSRSAVRCRLYTVVPSPCSLDRDADTVCAQALWERRWLVRIVRGRHGTPDAHILKISSGPSGGDGTD